MHISRLCKALEEAKKKCLERDRKNQEEEGQNGLPKGVAAVWEVEETIPIVAMISASLASLLLVLFTIQGAVLLGFCWGSCSGKDGKFWGIEGSRFWRFLEGFYKLDRDCEGCRVEAMKREREKEGRGNKNKGRYGRKTPKTLSFPFLSFLLRG